MKFHDHETDSDVLILEGEGGLDESMAIQLVHELYGRIDKGLLKIILDCSQMDFISSLDVGLLARVHTRLAMKGGDLKLCSAKGMIPEVLRVTGMNKVFDVHPDLQSALASFRSG